jgi:ubiquitin carboxyl-terminal hydrolase 7
MIDPMKGKQTLKAAELQDGDIICFQKASNAKAVHEHDKEWVYCLLPVEVM